MDHLHKMTKALTYGDVKCAEKERRTWLYLSWAAGVMMSTRTSEETTGGCTTNVFAEAVYKKAKCYCTCGCGPDYGVFPPENECEVVIAYTVISAVDVDQRPIIEGDGPSVGDAYLVVTDSVGSDIWTVNTIQTWNGSGWDAITLPNNQNVLASDTQDIWITYNSTTPGLLYPPIVASLVGYEGEYSIVSSYPATASGSGRDVTIRSIVNGFYVVSYSGPETALATAELYSFGGTPITGIEAIYLDGNCSVTVPGEVEYPFGECGEITVVVTPEATCESNTFTIEVDVTVANGFPLGQLIVFVNGLQQTPVPAQFGAVTIGPFQSLDVVTFTITNSFDSECNYASTEYRNPQLPQPDYTVLQAVDASFEPSAIPGEAYLIISDTEDSGNTWASHVGEIWDGSGWVVPADGEFIQTESPSGPTSYWEMVGTTPTQVFPPITILYNTVTEVWVALPNPVAPFLNDMEVIIRYQCTNGAPEVLYAGVISGFAETSFTPACDFENVSGDITYFVECPLTIPSVVEEFTPTGDPEPFDPGGLNDLILAIAVQNDGQILVGGFFDNFGTSPVVPCPNFTRLNVDGSLDTAYNDVVYDVSATVPGVNNRVDDIAIDRLGNAVIIGAFTTINDATHNRIARFLPDGSIDPSFVTGTGFNAQAFSIIIFPTGHPRQGSILVVGTFTSYNGTAVPGIVCLLPDGTIDTNFQSGVTTGFNSTCLRIALSSDGNILAAGGTWSLYNGVPIGLDRIIRLKPDGTRQSTVTPVGFNNDVSGISEQPNGDLIVTGAFTQYGTDSCKGIARISDVGVWDEAFSLNTGLGLEGTAPNITNSSLILPNGQILVTIFVFGNTWDGTPSNGLVRLNFDGTRDLTYNPGPGYNGRTEIAVIDQTNGTIIVGGGFTLLDTLVRRRIARVN